jgi:HAD superfamily hydrolase (TIGR01450 family)
MNIDKNALKYVKIIGMDLDGVVYQGRIIYDGVSEALEKIESMGYEVEFLTNNSTRASIEIEESLKSLGIKLKNIRVINSIDTTIELLSRLKIPKNKKIHVLGSESLKRSIQNEGYLLSEAFGSDYLIVGFTPEFNYQTICSGVDALHSRAMFIACNVEGNYPDHNGHLKPGCGAIVAAISAGSKQAPNYISGKPSTIMLEMLMAKYRCSPHEILVIGDTLESDIQMALNFGSPSCWVSGTKNQIRSHSQRLQLTNWLNCLKSFLKYRILYEKLSYCNGLL